MCRMSDSTPDVANGSSGCLSGGIRMAGPSDAWTSACAAPHTSCRRDVQSVETS